jgi:hypothetical protein
MSAADRFAQFEQFEDAPALVDTLDDYRRVGERGGAARLLRDLVKQGWPRTPSRPLLYSSSPSIGGRHERRPRRVSRGRGRHPWG